ncbi:MAG: hypothetical protein AB1742_02170 [bacterium]
MIERKEPDDAEAVDVTGYPLSTAEKILEEKGFRVGKVICRRPPEDVRLRGKTPRWTTRFVTGWSRAGGGVVDVEVVECGDIRAEGGRGRGTRGGSRGRRRTKTDAAP